MPGLGQLLRRSGRLQQQRKKRRLREEKAEKDDRRRLGQEEEPHVPESLAPEKKRGKKRGEESLTLRAYFEREREREREREPRE